MGTFRGPAGIRSATLIQNALNPQSRALLGKNEMDWHVIVWHENSVGRVLLVYTCSIFTADGSVSHNPSVCEEFGIFSLCVIHALYRARAVSVFHSPFIAHAFEGYCASDS